MQLALPLDRQRALDATLDDVRDRFGSEAITRPFCSAATPAGPRRCCPTRAARGRAPVVVHLLRAVPDRLQADVIGAGLEVRVHRLGDRLGRAVRDHRVDQPVAAAVGQLALAKPSRSRLPA